MQLPINIKKHLLKQKLSQWNIETGENKLYDNIIIIPAINEYENSIKLIESLSKNSEQHLKNTLIIFIINNLETETDLIKNENQRTINYLKEIIRNNSFNVNIGLVDASTKPLPKKSGGVGLARKTGLDLALNYFDYSNSKKKILISLDADCLVSENYLETIVKSFNNNDLKVAVSNFEHILPDDKIQKFAIINYEIFLRYYVLGLKYAKSKFAYHSIGSTIICDLDSYIKVGGMNKKKAGEDFYFLEKLAKIANIIKLDKAFVYPSSRISTRVPFGTGSRIKRFVNNIQNEYLLYSPKSFETLKDWLMVFSKVTTSEKMSGSLLLQEAKKIDLSLHNFLKEQKFDNDWDNILDNSKTNEQLNKQKINWMDGFRTLKLIHYLRDNKFPNNDMFDAIDELLGKLDISNIINRHSSAPPLDVQQKYLKILKTLT